MKIDSASFALQATHSSVVREQSQESLRMWRGPQRPDFEATTTRSEQPAAVHGGRSLISISQAARASLSIEIAAMTGTAAQSATAPPSAGQISSEAKAIAESADAVANDPFLFMLRSMIETMTGQTIKTFSADDLSRGAPPPRLRDPATSARSTATQPASAGFGLEYDYHAVREEIETTDFSAEGVINTANGQQISFKLELQMSRSYREETSVSLRAGDAVRKDPIVLNFNGNAAQLSDQRFRFDLEGDGKAENIAMLASGSGYLALDRNNNGRIDNGRELFGPATNSGFGELSALDSDGNGWIDENDAVFEQLKVWIPAADEQRGELSSLKERGVGAISLANVASPFELRDTGNRSLGAIKSGGVFLFEDGRPGSIQEIDLTL